MQFSLGEGRQRGIEGRNKLKEINPPNLSDKSEQAIRQRGIKKKL